MVLAAILLLLRLLAKQPYGTPQLLLELLFFVSGLAFSMSIWPIQGTKLLKRNPLRGVLMRERLQLKDSL